MSSTRSKRPEPCAYEDCGSRRFHIGNDGYTYCDQGHQQSERGTIVVEDPGDIRTPGRKARRKDDSDAESRTSKGSSFSGADAFEHYLLCLQLILRKQLRWLIDIQRLPEELEVLVRDLWALRLQKLQGKIAYESDTDTEAPSSQVFSSQSDSEIHSSSRSSKRSRRKDTKPKEGTPVLSEMLCLCYIGTLLLRIPVTVADLHEWTSQGELAHYRASREIPASMKEHLPPRYQRLLNPQDSLRAESVHHRVLNMLDIFNTEFGMAFPPLNTPLLLYRWIKSLALPVEIFVATQRLAKILDVDVGSFLATSAATNVVLRYPEVQLMALMIVATKLLFSFDSIERYSEDAADLSALLSDWSAWAKSRSERTDDSNRPSGISFEQAFNFDESDCLTAADDRLDAYLDWYQDNVATEEVREHGRAGKDADFRRALFTMFPNASRTPNEKTTQSTRATERTDSMLRVRHCVALQQHAVGPTDGREVHRLGSFYRRFRSVEDLSGPIKTFFTEAASLAGVSLEGMVQAVFLMERKLQKCEENFRKKGAGRG